MKKNENNFKTVLDLLPEKSLKSFLIKLVEALPGIVIILNEERRLIYSNQILLDKLSIPTIDEIFEMRPGEIFKCVNVEHGEDGCGSSSECQLCGAYNAIKMSIKSGSKVSNDCRILSQDDNKSLSYNLKFTSIPFTTEDSKFFMITIDDISADIRKKELEKIFYHDVINSMAGIHGVLRLMKQDASTDPVKYKILDMSYNNLKETINEQRDIALAEEGELGVKHTDIRSLQVLENIQLTYHESNAFEGKIVIAKDAIDVEFVSDPILLNRILTNMAKNALEACQKDDLVTLNVKIIEQSLRFSVHNPAYIPIKNQYQIFERSFTTKGSGRGLGTFSMKLIGENYLGGKIDFISKQEKGTTFTFQLPFED